MAIVPTGLVQQAQLAKEITKAKRKLGKETVRVNYSLGEDSTGEPSIFFRVVLPDKAAEEDKIADSAAHIISVLSDEVRPYENWGLLPYFRFRSKSEQDSLNDSEWA